MAEETVSYPVIRRGEFVIVTPKVFCLGNTGSGAVTVVTKSCVGKAAIGRMEEVYFAVAM